MMNEIRKSTSRLKYFAQKLFTEVVIKHAALPFVAAETQDNVNRAAIFF